MPGLQRRVHRQEAIPPASPGVPEAGGSDRTSRRVRIVTGVEFLAFCLGPILGIFAALAFSVGPTAAILSVPFLFILSIGIMAWWVDHA